MNLRGLEAASIRDFVQQAASEGYITGSVLDYGCGKQPYRDIIEEIKPFGGPIYQGFDKAGFPANVSGNNIGEGDPLIMQGWGTILCTQVVQYVPDVRGLLKLFNWSLQLHGHLVMTYPTNWPEVEREDLHRFTKAGMELLLKETGFTILRHERRGQVFPHDGVGKPLSVEDMALGYGVVARA